MRKINLSNGRWFSTYGLALCAGLALFLLSPLGNTAQDPKSLEFDDRPLEHPVNLPDWFKLSFLDLQEDIYDAKKGGKQGLILYFGQKDCAYCKALIDINWGRSDIVAYTRKHFDVVAIDVRGDRPVKRPDGTVQLERDYAVYMKTTFTPTLIFFDTSGTKVLKVTGYHPPYQFRAALEYVADGHYHKEGFRDYLARGDTGLGAGQTKLRQRSFFSKPPYMLDRSRITAQGPLLVFFEGTQCHSCDVLHLGPLGKQPLIDKMKQLEVVQLDMWSDTPVVTPDGQRLSAKQWAENLGLFYTPTLLFFNEQGKEIIRVDSVVHFYRLSNVMEYILSGAYKRHPSFRKWRQESQPKRAFKPTGKK